MLPLSEITIVGNLGNDPETKYTANGTMAVSFSVAVNKKGRGDDKDTTNWYRVTTWGKLAETCDTLANNGALLKGAQVLVLGELTVREFTRRDGDSGYSLDINANRVNIARGTNDESGGDDDDNHRY